MADLGIKLTAEETAKAFEGMKINPNEMNSAPRSKYPGPKNVTDEEAGIASVPISSRVTKIGPVGVATDKNQFTTAFRHVNEPYLNSPEFQAASPLEKENIIRIFNEAKKEMMADFGGQIAGSAITAGVGEALSPLAGKMAKTAVTKAAPNAMSSFAKTPTNAELMKSVIGGAAKKLGTVALGEHGAEALGELMSRAAPVAGSVAGGAGKLGAGAASVAAKAAPSAVGAAAVDVRAGSDPKVYRGAMSNAIERLRASAPGNPRAQELLSRIDQIPMDNGAGMSEVTQGTVGNE